MISGERLKRASATEATDHTLRITLHGLVVLGALAEAARASAFSHQSKPAWIQVAEVEEGDDVESDRQAEDDDFIVANLDGSDVTAIPQPYEPKRRIV